MTHRSANGRFLMVVPLLLAAGCATVPTERSFERVQATVGDRVGTAIAWPTTPEGRDAIDRRVEEVLSEPLDAERAVMIALLNNRELRANTRVSAWPTRILWRRVCLRIPDFRPGWAFRTRRRA